MEDVIHSDKADTADSEPHSTDPGQKIEVASKETRTNASSSLPRADASSRKNKAISDNFLKTILEFNRRNNTPILEPPQISGKPVNLYILYGYVLKAGGSHIVDEKRHWDKISTSLGFPGQEEIVASIHERCLKLYEKEWLAKRKLAQGRGNREATGNTSSTSFQQNTNEVTDNAPIEKSRVLHISKHRVPQPNVIGSSLNAYRPLKRTYDTYAGLDLSPTITSTKDAAKLRPFPAFQELGRLDIQGITRSIESAIPAEVGNALDIMVIISGDRRWGLPLLHCADLPEILVDCLMQNIDVLKLDEDIHIEQLRGYNDLMRATTETTLHLLSSDMSVRQQDHKRTAALQRVLSVLTILRNLAFTEVNQETIACTHGFVNVISSGLLVICAKTHQSLVPVNIALDFLKDAVTLLSLTGAFLTIENARSLEIIFSTLLSFVPHTLYYSDDSSGSLSQQPYIVAVVDALAKILARDIPNRQLCEALLTQKGVSFAQCMLRKLMDLASLVLPKDFNEQNTHLLAQRIPLLQHSLILAELAAEMCSSTSLPPVKWLDDLAELPIRVSVLLCALSTRSISRSMISPPEVSILKRRSISILKILLRQNGTVSNGAHLSATASRLRKLVSNYEADIML